MTAPQKDRTELEVGLKRAIQWIGERRKADPKASVAKLIDEASLRFELSPLQVEFLIRQLSQPT